MKEAILVFLREHPNQPPTIIADNCQSLASSVRKALTILRRKGLVLRSDDGTYVATPIPSETSTATAQ